MFVNMALVVLILVAALVGLAIGGAFGDTIAPLVGLAVGSVAGIGLARWLYVRRHR
jgi:hypothetical protein